MIKAPKILLIAEIKNHPNLIWINWEKREVSILMMIWLISLKIGKKR